MTYAQEKAIKDQELAKRSKKFVFNAAGFDIYNHHGYLPKDGSIVVKAKPPGGCPKNGTMGHCYIADGTTGRFICLVDQRSLKPLKN